MSTILRVSAGGDFSLREVAFSSFIFRKMFSTSTAFSCRCDFTTGTSSGFTSGFRSDAEGETTATRTTSDPRSSSGPSGDLTSGVTRMTLPGDVGSSLAVLGSSGVGLLFVSNTSHTVGG